MPVIAAHGLTMGFNDFILFDSADFEINEHDKAGLIGANGSGKSTLFKLITKQLEPISGEITISSKISVGYVEQHTCSDPGKTTRQEMLSVFSDLIDDEKTLENLHDEIDRVSSSSSEKLSELIEKQTSLTESFQSRGGLTFRSRAESMLSGLGFTDDEKNMTVDNLSGGQRTKIALGKLLLKNPNLILLDEPTNHLDIKSIEWLENFLSDYKGAILLVSHDRYFLDRVTNKTLEIEHKKITVRKGNYSVFQKLKEEEKLSAEREYEKKSAEIKRIESIIEQQKRFNQERNYVTIASKQKQIDRLKSELVKPESDEKAVKLKWEICSVSGNDVIMVNSMSKSFGEKKLFSGVSFNVYRGDRVFLIGINGCGKSTLLKCMLGKIRPDKGYCRFGANVRPGYFDQIQSGLNSEKTVIEEVYDKFPGKTISEIKGYLGAFHFRGDETEKLMRELSGGERARIELLELMLKKPNLLLLDEPTNHLDIPSKETLEESLTDYEGTIFCVSHDRYLINKLATSLLILKDGVLTEFDGTYDDYINSLGEARILTSTKKQGKKVNEYTLRKQRETEERKRKTRLSKIESLIETNSRKQDEIKKKLEDDGISSDYLKVTDLTNELDILSQEEEKLYEEWELLSEASAGQ